MQEADFQIEYKGQPLRVSQEINGGNIFFIVHLKKPVVIAEALDVDENWTWYEVGNGITPLSKELGELIEETDV